MSMQDVLLALVDSCGYWGIFLLILIENVFPPIPSEAVLLFGGALTVSSTLNIPGVVAAATAGSLAGAVVLYALGRCLPAARLKALFASRFGRILHLKPEYVDRAEKWFQRYRGRAVLLCRCVPLLRSIISIPAGFAKMGLPSFLLLTLIGSTVWNAVLVGIGAMLGTAWDTALPYLDQYTVWAVVAVVVLAISFVIVKMVKKRKRNP